MNVTRQLILIIEDEPDVVTLLERQFRKAEFATAAATEGAEGIAIAQKQKPALIILDLMLPKMSGLEVCRILKSDRGTRQVPIIMLTAKAEEVDRIVGLELGADDYVTKPFSPREVVLRAQAVLRRSGAPPEEQSLVAGPITIDRVRHQVSVDGEEVNLTGLEFKLLHRLLERRGRVQDRERLLTDVWGYESSIDTRTVDTHVRRLREKLGPAGEIIETVRGFGYRLRDH